MLEDPKIPNYQFVGDLFAILCDLQFLESMLPISGHAGWCFHTVLLLLFLSYYTPASFHYIHFSFYLVAVSRTSRSGQMGSSLCSW